MTFPQKWWQILSSASLLVATITMWILFAPLQFGGSAAYVILSGNSMSPEFELGDLVVTFSKNNYRQGDVVTYQHPEIGYVFHRIIDIKADGKFILKGDNNSWTDSYHPSKDEVIGKLWLHIPSLGKTLETLRSPLAFAILSLVFGFSLFILVVPPDKKIIRRKKQNRGNKFMSDSRAKTGEKLFILTVLVFGMLLLGIITFRQPLFNEVQVPLSYQQDAIFRYTASVPDGIYDSTQIQPGEPIFRQLNGSFSVAMDYFFLSSYPSTIDGAYRLLATVSDGTGWKRTLELVPETAFSDLRFTVSETLSLNKIQNYIDVFEKETGVARGRYNLSVLADIQIKGSIEEIALEDRFLPSLNFSVTELEVVLEGAAGNKEDILHPSQSNAVMRIEYEHNSLNILGLAIPIRTARWISVGIGVPALIALGIFLLQIYHATQHSEWDRVRIWYNSMLIEARDAHILTAPNRVEIASMDDLANLAEQDQRTILHLPNGDSHHFFVQTPEQIYHYEIEESQPAEIVTAVSRQQKNPNKWRFPRVKRNGDLWDAYEHALKGWANAVDNKLYMQGQADIIAEMAYALARALNIHGSELEEIRMVAYLHKIGLMDIPNDVLQKKKELTQKELELIRNHPTIARNQLNKAELLKPIAEIIYYQNERWDGSGPSEGLEGEEIPIGSRIISVINVWNALQHSRPYRDAWGKEEIGNYFHEQSGKQFDPRVIEAFFTLLHKDEPPSYLEAIEAKDNSLDGKNA